MLEFIFRCVVAMSSLILYSYSERFYSGSGLVISSVCVIYLVSRVGGYQSVIAPLVFGANLFFLFSGDEGLLGSFPKKGLNNVCFIILLISIVLAKSKDESNNDLKVDFNKPYETSIRRLLRKHDPAKLGEVDRMMRDNKGHEKELYISLKEQYNAGAPNDSMIFSDLPDDVHTGGNGPYTPGKNGGDAIMNDGYDYDYDFIKQLDDDAEPYIKAIRKFLDKYDPNLQNVERLLKDFKGREQELLKLLHEEYDVEYYSPAAKGKYNEAPVRHSATKNKGKANPFTSKEETMLDIARRDAREAIEREIKKKY